MDHADLYTDNPTRPLKTKATNSGSGSSPLADLYRKLVAYFKLLVQVYPRAALSCFVSLGVLLLVIGISSYRRNHPNYEDMTRHSMEGNYSALLENDYASYKANIHHWCLFGGNDKCYCEDPTQGQSREETRGWADAHNRNKHIITDNDLYKRGGMLDVVFLGDQTFEAWGAGQFLDRNFREGPQIASYFNQTFHTTSLQGLSLGIYTDRVSSLLLCLCVFCVFFKKGMRLHNSHTSFIYSFVFVFGNIFHYGSNYGTDGVLSYFTKSIPL